MPSTTTARCESSPTDRHVPPLSSDPALLCPATRESQWESGPLRSLTLVSKHCQWGEPQLYYLIKSWRISCNFFISSFACQNDWVGEQDWIPTLIHTTFWAGNVLGCLIWGFSNDRFGRRNTIFWSHVVYFLGNLGTLIVPICLSLLDKSPIRTALSVSLLGIFRLSAGCSHHTVSHLPCLLALEYCGINHRTIPIMCLMVSYSFASISTPLLASLMSHWSQLALPATALVLPVLLLSKWDSSVTSMFPLQWNVQVDTRVALLAGPPGKADRGQESSH